MKFLSDKFKGKNSGLEHVFQLIHCRDFQRAVEVLRPLLATLPLDLKGELYHQLNTIYNLADFKGFLALAKELVKHDSANTDLLNKIGNCHRRLKDRKEANQYYKEALKADKTFTTAFNNFAASLANVYRFDAEIPLLLKSIERFKDFIVPDYIQISSITTRRQILDILIRKYETKENDHVQELLLEKELMFQIGDLKEVRGLTQQIFKKRQTARPEALGKAEYESILKEVIDHDWETLNDEEKETLEIEVYNMGIDYLKSREPKKSLSHFKKLKVRDCPFEYVDLMLALSEYLADRSSKTLDKLRLCYEKNPEDRYTNFNLGMAFREQKNQLLSRKHLIKAAEIFDSLEGLINPNKILKRGKALIERGQGNRALIFIKTAYRELKSRNALFTLAKLLLELEQYLDALIAFEELKLNFPEFNKMDKELEKLNTYYLRKGNIYLTKGNYKKAVEKYELALRANRNEEVLRKLLVCYRRLESGKANEINLELNQLEESRKAVELEEKIKTLVRDGKEAFRKRKFTKAIEYFEDALEIRPDKGVFIFLAHIYKTLNRKHALAILVRTYKPMFPNSADLRQFDKYE